MNIEEAKELKGLISEFEILGISLEHLTSEDIGRIGLSGVCSPKHSISQTHIAIKAPETTISYACEDIVHRRNEIRDILSKIKY